MYCQHICKSYKEIEAKTTIIYTNQIEINENRCLKILIEKYNRGFGNYLFAIKIVEIKYETPTLEEILVISKEGSFSSKYRLNKCICNNAESISYDESRFFSINELGGYRIKTTFRELYNILDNLDLRKSKKRLDAILLYILRDDLKKNAE